MSSLPPVPFLRLLLMASALLGALPAQLDWRIVRSRPYRGIAFDPLRGQMVGWGVSSPGPGGCVIEWDRRFWRNHVAVIPPTLRGFTVWDPVQARMLFLAITPPTTQTWSWEGQTWVHHTPATAAPPMNYEGQLATDFARGRVVYFGGWSFGVQTQTWEWDGQNWQQRFPANAPSPRVDFGMAWHPSRNRVTLHGGSNGTALSDTWEWDGANWSLRTTSGPPRRGHSMAAAPDGNLVLFGGSSSTVGPLTQTWSWNGTTWTQRIPAHVPGVERPAMTHDSVHNVTLMLSLSGVSIGEFWEWDGLDWVRRSPGYAGGGAWVADHDRGRVVSYGGGASTTLTREWDGSEWRQFTSPGPSNREDTAMAFAGNARVLLFGGAQPFTGTPYGDTWLWNGSGWSQQVGVPSPPPRANHAMAFDSVRGEVVLFGGNNTLADTWTWNGAWTQRNPATQPPGRARHAMAFDAARGVTVMFGGVDPPDLWEWNGVDWQSRTVAGGPPGLRWVLMNEAPDGQGVLVLGGNPITGSFTQVRRWDGTAWSTAPFALPPSGVASAFDPVHRHVVMAADNMLLTLEGPAAAGVTAFGLGCTGTAGVPTLRVARDWPFLGNTITFEIRTVPASALVLLVMGVSGDQFGLLPLPLDLAAIGMPQCTLYTSMDADAWLLATGGVATHALAVPNLPALVGLELFAQAAVVDPGANPASLVASNGLRFRVGQ